MRWLSHLVTATIVLGSATAVVVVAQRKLAKPVARANFHTYALFRDASKIAVGSPVVIAGVKVGQVEKVGISGTMARIDIGLRADLQLPIDSWATRRAESLFGDAYVEIIPGGQTDGVAAGAGQMLQSGQPIARVIEGASTDKVLRGMERAIPRINRALEMFDESTQTGRKWVTGNYDEKFNAVLTWLEEGRIEAPIARVNEALISLENMTARTERALAGGERKLFGPLDRIDAAISKTRASMQDAQQQMHDGFAAARSQVAQLDPLIDDATEVLAPSTPSVARGELQALLDSPALYDEANDAVASAAETVRVATDLRTAIGLRTEFDVLGGTARVVASARIAARNDKFYLVEGTLRPQGLPSATLEQRGDGQWIKTAQVRDKYLLTAQIGKRFGRFNVRGGLKESGLGMGIDALFNHDRLTLSADVFESKFDGMPNVRVSAALALFRSLYLLAGIDEALTKAHRYEISDWTGAMPGTLSTLRYGRDYFVGGMLKFSDEDMLSLLTFYGALIVGIL